MTSIHFKQSHYIHFPDTAFSSKCHINVIKCHYAKRFSTGDCTMTTPAFLAPFITSTRRTAMAGALIALLAGCASMSQPTTVADTIANTPSLSTLNSLVTSAGLTETLKGTGPFTVFAPSNEAFKAVPAKTMEALGKDPAALKGVLTYHVLATKAMAADVKNGKAKTVNGANVELSKSGEFVTVENAMVTQSNISATNGVVHIIDTVLIPPAKK
jgi:uncharacterized surface protein with fasciclin (FAS1) repeats